MVIIFPLVFDLSHGAGIKSFREHILNDSDQLAAEITDL
jgi:hypothetical protein